MKHIPLKLTAMAVAGLIAMATGAQAGGLYDSDDDKVYSGNDKGYSDDDNGYSNQYNRQSLSSYCYKNPYDDACDPYAKKYHKKKTYNNSYGSGGRCAALIRAVGKRNLVRGFARNSARFAWARETRFVHGDQYASWHNARNAHISCTRVGALNSCVATATPCR
jgi:hypothetical protein